MTLRYVAFAFRPASPAEKEPTAITLHGLLVGQQLGQQPGGLRNLGQLLEGAELRQLSQELAIGLGIGRILVLQLRHQQLEERVAPEPIVR